MKKVFVVLALSIFFTDMKAQGNYKILNKIHLDGDDGYDYLTADKATNRLYISHGNVVQVLDIETKKSISRHTR